MGSLGVLGGTGGTGSHRALWGQRETLVGTGKHWEPWWGSGGTGRYWESWGTRGLGPACPCRGTGGVRALPRGPRGVGGDSTVTPRDRAPQPRVPVWVLGAVFHPRVVCEGAVGLGSASVSPTGGSWWGEGGPAPPPPRGVQTPVGREHPKLRGGSHTPRGEREVKVIVEEDGGGGEGHTGGMTQEWGAGQPFAPKGAGWGGAAPQQRCREMVLGCCGQRLGCQTPQRPPRHVWVHPWGWGLAWVTRGWGLSQHPDERRSES